MKKDWSHVGSVDEVTRALAAAEAEARIREVLMFQSAIDTVAEKCADEEMAVGLPFYSLVRFSRARLAELRSQLEKNSDRSNG
jgi:predicted LPLAT superfamily acyltransferase